MSQLTISPLNAKYIEKQQQAKVETQPSETPQEPKRINKKKLAFTIAAATGVAALAFAAIHQIKKGGGKIAPNELKDEMQEILPDFEKGVKKFFDSNNELASDVSLKNGKALNADGSLFSGAMKTMNGKGEEITLKYLNGNIVNSRKNGQIFKFFDEYCGKDGFLDRNKAVVISEFNKDGDMINQVKHRYFDNGKIAKTEKKQMIAVNSNAEEKIQGIKALEFSQDGKLMSDFEYLLDGEIVNGKVFYDDGKTLYKKFGNLEYEKYGETTYLQNGNVLKQKTADSPRYGISGTLEEDNYSAVLQNADDVTYFDDNGAFINKSQFKRAPFGDTKNGEVSFENISPDKRLKLGFCDESNTAYLEQIDTATGQSRCITFKTGNKIENGNADYSFTSKELEDAADKLENSLLVASTEDLQIQPKGADEKEKSEYIYDKFFEIIDKIKNYAEK